MSLTALWFGKRQVIGFGFSIITCGLCPLFALSRVGEVFLGFPRHTRPSKWRTLATINKIKETG